MTIYTQLTSPQVAALRALNPADPQVRTSPGAIHDNVLKALRKQGLVVPDDYTLTHDGVRMAEWYRRKGAVGS